MAKINKYQQDRFTKAFINPKVLKWAREVIQVSRLDIVKKLNKEYIKEKDLISWEEGTDFPTIYIAKILSKLYGIKFITFYLPSVPKKIKPLKDFRGIPDPNIFSKNFIFLMREIQGKQEWTKEYLTNKSKKPIAFVDSIALEYGIEHCTKEAVNLLNKLLLSDTIELSSKVDDTFKILVKKIESLGVFVSIGNSYNGHHLYSVEPSEARGFAIADKIAPFVFINSKDNKKAQIFTLIHEVCHLFLGESGISDTSSGNKNPTEIICNKATAEFLMPTEKFHEIWNSTKTNSLDEKIKILGEKFPTSRLSITIRAYALRLISNKTFDETYAHYKKEVKDFTAIKKKQQAKGGFSDPYLKTLKINGKQFVNTVMEAYSSSEIMISSACSLLGIPKTVNFDVYEQKWSKLL
ncbi:MAG: ImmA/IrrE family metallo-endopeptidase [Elusimicrobiota bacterium]|jgi:Zn-dependent peptidase ImmA (M78 family)|nr:ImmA/IrrE family metallo-endopeptidase [Elusimicrobiota bacterium]